MQLILGKIHINVCIIFVNSGLSLRFQVAGYIQQVGGESNS